MFTLACHSGLSLIQGTFVTRGLKLRARTSLYYNGWALNPLTIYCIVVNVTQLAMKQSQSGTVTVYNLNKINWKCSVEQMLNGTLASILLSSFSLLPCAVLSFKVSAFLPDSDPSTSVFHTQNYLTDYSVQGSRFHTTNWSSINFLQLTDSLSLYGCFF